MSPSKGSRLLARTAAASLAVALLASCGGDVEVPRVEVREPGQGSGTLLVQAFVKGEATAANATDPGRFRTRLEVRVRRGAFPVKDAFVRVNDVVLVHRGGGVYAEPSQLLGLPPDVAVVTVRAGTDWVNGAVSSPGAHSFTQPSRAGDVLAGPPLELAWTRPARADTASLDVSGWAITGDIDDGRYAIPGGAPGLQPAPSTTCGLWRENRVWLRGGATGSSLAVSVWNGLTFTLASR